MTRSTLLATATALLALLGSAASFAGDELNRFPEAEKPSNVTRADVKAQVGAARADGSLGVDSDSPPPVRKQVRSMTTRESVKAELQRARANGPMGSFDQGDQYAQPAPSSLDRSSDAVRAEPQKTVRATRSGS